MRPGALLIAVFLATTLGCGSSGGATCPDKDPLSASDPKPCPICPVVRPAQAPTKIGAETLKRDRERHFALIAMAADGASALVRLDDAAAGAFYQLVDLNVTPVPKLIKSWRLEDVGEKDALKAATKAMKVVAPGPPSQRNAADIALLAADDGAEVTILAMKGERAVPIATLPRLTDEDGGLSDVSIIKLAWDPTGTRAIIIHRQKSAGPPALTTEWLHVVPVAKDALPFD